MVGREGCTEVGSWEETRMEGIAAGKGREVYENGGKSEQCCICKHAV